ncbi:MAG TPA: DUF4347 domain-containing protein, partial [Albitalea sp.]
MGARDAAMHWLRRWRQPPEAARPRVEELEPRILYSADLNPLWQGDADAPEAEVRLLEDAPDAAEGVGEHEARRLEIVFVDPGVPGWEALVADLRAADPGERDLEVVVLDPAGDGIAQVSAALAERDGIDAIHLVSHGRPGAMVLAGSTLDAATIDAHAGHLSAWRDALGEEADILVYGCDVAGNADGEALVRRIAALTGADVAASTDATGSALQGGDWDLEHQAGRIETAVALEAPAQARFVGVLADTVVHGYEVPFGELSTYELRAGVNGGQTFRYDSPGATYTVDKVGLVLDRDATVPAGQTITVSLRSSWGGADIARGTVSGSSLGTSMGWVTIDLDAPATLNDNQTYYLVIASSMDNGGLYACLDNTGTYAAGTLVDSSGRPDSSGSGSGSNDLPFRLIKANTAPAITSNGGGATASVSVSEGTTAVTTVTAADADAGDTLTYGIVPVASGGGADAAR